MNLDFWFLFFLHSKKFNAVFADICQYLLYETNANVSNHAPHQNESISRKWLVQSQKSAGYNISYYIARKFLRRRLQNGEIPPGDVWIRRIRLNSLEQSASKEYISSFLRL